MQGRAMKNSVRSLVLSALFFASLATAQAQPTDWEYLVVNAALNNRALQQMLNARGADGWELVAFTGKDVAVFKRKAR